MQMPYKRGLPSSVFNVALHCCFSSFLYLFGAGCEHRHGTAHATGSVRCFPLPRMSHVRPTDVPHTSHGCPTYVPRMSHVRPTDVPHTSPLLSSAHQLVEVTLPIQPSCYHIFKVLIYILYCLFYDAVVIHCINSTLTFSCFSQ